MALPKLTSNQIEQIARIVGDTGSGFTGSEIGHLLAQCHMDDPNPELTKWKRLYNAFCVAVNGSGSTNSIYKFLQNCMELLESGDIDHPEPVRNNQFQPVRISQCTSLLLPIC